MNAGGGFDLQSGEDLSEGHSYLTIINSGFANI